MKKLLLLAMSFTVIQLYAQPLQFSALETYPYENTFRQAYQLNPEIPQGILEAVAWSNTRFTHLSGTENESCVGYPHAYSVMGLIADGHSYFNENLQLVARLSGYAPDQIKTSPETSILAYASAYVSLYHQLKNDYPDPTGKQTGNFNVNLHAEILLSLTEIPDSGRVNEYARQSQLYQIFTFLKKADNINTYHIQTGNFSIENYFGDNYLILSARKIIFGEHGITNENGKTFQFRSSGNRSSDYGPAIWNPAASCNYSSRNGTAVSAITIHTVQGTYAGCISWFQNCSASVSAHYVVRSSDGQITQMVLESAKAWHVGTENPYTIGYEHEGYVGSTGWYTNAMYAASADLSRDICNSGYGINPLRTYYGPSSSGTNTLGGCVKIKGHQHYPNQTHTDPGIYWDWEYYYELINNNPGVTTLNTTNGTFYDTGGSSGNYSDDERYQTLISIPGATSITLNFTAFDIENNWDYLYIYDGSTNTAPLIGVYTGTNSPGTVVSSGGSLLIEFRSDCSTTSSGWAANWTSNANPAPPADVIPPTTLVNVPGTWVTQNFTATFNDADNTGGSGLEKSYYQVIDYDGSDWRANPNAGFYSDNFDLPNINPEWTSMTGNWAINNGYLEQSDETNGNTNLYTFIDHSLSNRYLYNWSGKMDGTGTNRRAGFHYFCDDPTMTNRNNSYFVWFRLDNAKVQLYKVVNDTFTLMSEVPFTFIAGQWYDFKVIYDRITGKHTVYIDNALIQTWTDPSPYNGGDYISFRSGNCIYTVNNLKVYRSRASSATVSVGPGSYLRYQNTNPTTPAGRIKSIVADSAGNLSAIDYRDVNVDWTAPSDVVTINDGSGSDIDTIYNNTELRANWTNAYDQHSAIARYWFAIGTTPGGTDIVNWTDNFWYDTMHVTGMNLTYGVTYYVSVKAENGAGLLSNITTSDGQLLLTPTQPPVANFVNGNVFICQGDSISFQNNSSNATSYSWIFQNGFPANSNLNNPEIYYNTTGTYQVTLIANGPGGSDTLIQNINVDVSLPVTADYLPTDTLVYIPNAFVGFTNQSANANGYHWDFGDGSFSTSQSPWHQYFIPGYFPVTLVAVNNACPADTIIQTIHVLDPNNVSELIDGNQLIINNPVDQSLAIRFLTNDNANYFVKIYSGNGQLIFDQQYNINQGENYLQINTGNYTEGIYFLQFSDNKKSNTVKSFTVLRH